MNHLCCQEAQLGPIEADFSRCVRLCRKTFLFLGFLGLCHFAKLSKRMAGSQAMANAGQETR
jgi:hypothetical protein